MKDYNDFLQGNDSVPSSLDQKIKSMIVSELNPNQKVIFLKLIGIHGFIGLLTMLFCPQFKMSLTNSYEFFHYLHHTFGESICMLICGCIFLGSGALFAGVVLNNAEVQTIKKSTFLYYTLLSILAVTIFFILGAEIYLNLVLFWLIGAIAGGTLFFKGTRLLFNIAVAK